jgi:formylglycine-generating enzyme required for sulfatase activity
MIRLIKRHWRTWLSGLVLCVTATAWAQTVPAIPNGAGKTFQECARACPLMVVVPAGEFSMGTSRLDVESDGREGPPHTVTFQKPFALGVYDVTRGEYARFVRATGYVAKQGCNIVDSQGRWITDPGKSWRNPGFAQTDRDPVVCVSWDDAQAYIAWLNKIVRPSDPRPGPYRLPSEAEWEYAARAGSSTSYYWGGDANHDLANFGIYDCGPCGAKQEGKDRWYFTSPVGAFAPNAFGLFDALGNVWQWTQDCTHYGFGGAPADGSAWMTDTDRACYNHVLRGGSWLDPDFLLTIFVRNPWGQDDHNYANGFRLARALE